MRGVEEFDGASYQRTLRLPHGVGVVALSEEEGHIRCVLRLEDMRDLRPAVERCRRLLDLDADPVAIRESLGTEQILGLLVRRAPGQRVPRSVDGNELAMRAVLGQQVSVAGACTLAGKLVCLCNRRIPDSLLNTGSSLTHLFPEPSGVIEANLEDLGMLESRRAALRGLVRVLDSGELVLDPGAERRSTEEQLLRIRGIGPWTASYIAMRALGDPDAFLPSDLGVRRAVEKLGGKGDPASITNMAERWRPWRAYATQHLWASLGNTSTAKGKVARKRTSTPQRPLPEHSRSR